MPLDPIPTSNATPAPFLVLNQLYKNYSKPDQPTVHALHDVNLQVHEGEFIAIMGASGSGKSTLLHLLGALDSASTGDCWCGQDNLSSMTAAQRTLWRREHIGFVFQSFNLLSRLSALDNVALPLMHTKLDQATRLTRAQQALHDVGLSDRAKHKPQELSGGQQQRVAIARALVNRPRLLLADEPTGALDSDTGQTIMRLLSRIHQQGQTLIVVTHDPDVAAWAHRKIIFKDGGVLSDEISNTANIS